LKIQHHPHELAHFAQNVVHDRAVKVGELAFDVECIVHAKEETHKVDVMLKQNIFGL
jgi:hypothetical protein